MASSTKRYIFGVRIFLQDVATQNTDIGLYSHLFGDNTSQYNITKITDFGSATIMKVTYTGTGLAPLFLTNGMTTGDKVVITGLSSVNNGTFTVLKVTETYFEVYNLTVSAESSKTSVQISSAYQFRWIQKYTENTTTDIWLDGMITQSGISNIVQAADYSRGGNTSMWEGCSVTIKNSFPDGTQFWKTISDAGISLSGLRAEIVEIDLDTAHAGTRANETVLRHGITELPSSWTETQYTIQIKDSNYKRRINIATLIDNDPINGNCKKATDDMNGKAIPVIFGKVDKAKFVRTANNTKILTNYEWGFDFAKDKVEFFPIVSPVESSEPTLVYTINISDSCITYPYGTGLLPGKFMQVVEGKCSGACRKIESISSTWSAGATTMEITITQYFEETLQGNATATATDQTWIKFVDVNSEYTGDVWPCKDFTDSNGIALSEGKEELYAYTDEKSVSVSAINTITPIKEKPLDFIRLPQFAYKNTSSSLNNSLNLSAELFNGDFDNMESYLILPVRDIVLPSTNLTGDNTDGMQSFENGIFYTPIYSYQPTLTYPSDLNKLINTDFNDTVSWTLTTSNSLAAPVFIATGIMFKLPIYPENFSFDSCYILTDISQINSSGGISDAIYIRHGRFKIETKLTNIKTLTAVPASTERNSYARNIPDFYYIENKPSTNNKDFYSVQNYSEGTIITTRYYTGIDNFILSDITDKNLYNSIDSMTIFIHTVLSSGSTTSITNTIRKILIAFKKSVSIKDAIYTPIQGRIFNDTWGARKTSADLIERPMDIFEHILRLQNWNETGNYGNPGLSYASNPQINTGTTQEGMTEYPTLDILKDYYVSRQIINYDDAYTDVLLKSLCQQYLLASYQDNTGKECVALLGKTNLTPEVSISLSDINPGSLGQVQEETSKNVFVQPYFQFNMDYATGDYKNIIRVTNVAQDVFDASYVTGYSAGDAEEIWNRCHALWNYFRVIEEPPSEITDCPWIGTKLDGSLIANIDDAKKYIFRTLEWFGAFKDADNNIFVANKKRISFSISYILATTIGATHKPWFTGMHFLLNLPHQTNSISIQCQIEKIEFDINQGTATINAIMYGVTDESSYYIKKSFDSYASLGWADWDNSYKTKAEEPTNENDVVNQA